LFWSARDAGFYLVPEGETDYFTYDFDEDLGFWVAEEPFEMTDDYQTGELDPGESHTETLVLLASTNDQTPEEAPEQMTFDTSYRIYEDYRTDDGEPMEWEFKLTLSEEDEKSVYTVEEADQLGEIPIRYDVGIEQENIHSSSNPVTVEVSLTNESDEIISYGERRNLLFWAASSDEYEQFILYPKEEAKSLYTFDDTAGLWVAEDGFEMTTDYQTDELEPGETHTETLFLLVRDEDDIPEEVPTELTFSANGMMYDKESNPLLGDSMDWSFTLEQQSS